MQVTTTHIQELTGSTFSGLKKIFKAAGLVGEKRGRAIYYDSQEALPAYYKVTLTGLYIPGKVGCKAKNPEAETSLTDEKRLLAIEQRRKLTIENDIKEGKLVSDVVISDVLKDVSHQLAAIFDEIPPKIIRANPSLTAREKGIIEKELAKVRNLAAGISYGQD